MADTDENESLVNALESIKGLLEQSETKLNAARESIQQATPKQASILDNRDLSEFDDNDDFDVPVLNDVVEPEPVSTGNAAGVDAEAMRGLIDDMQLTLEKNMRDTLMQAVVRAEGDLKKQIKAYLDQLRNLLDE